MHQPKPLENPTWVDESWESAGWLPPMKGACLSKAIGRKANCPADVKAFADRRAEAAFDESQAPRRNQNRATLGNEDQGGYRGRMRVRLLGCGSDGLADYELLEMLLFLVDPMEDTKRLAKRLMNQFGSFARVVSAPAHELLKVSSVGRRTVVALKLMHCGAIRLTRADFINKPVFSNWDQLMEYLQTTMAREYVEQFRILFLDTKNRLIADELQGGGTINHAPVYPREVTRRAIELHAASLILVHNHPSGDPTPSTADVEMTRQVQQILKSLGISMHDHIIVGNGYSLSLRKEGLI